MYDFTHNNNSTPNNDDPRDSNNTNPNSHDDDADSNATPPRLDDFLSTMFGAKVTSVALTPDAPSGYEPDQYSDVKSVLINYNERFADADPALFRDTAINNTMACLISRMKPNALLTGPAGSGKTRIVEDIARRIANDDASVPSALRDYTIYELPLSALVAGSGVVGQLEGKVEAVLKMFADPDEKAILFIDEIHLLVDSGNSHTYGKIAQILKPALARGDLHLIGATTTQEAISLNDDPAFNRRFTSVMIGELSQEQTTQIISFALASYEAHYDNRINVDAELAAYIAQTADAYVSSTLHRPDNALTLLDRSMAAESIQLHSLINDGITHPATTVNLSRSRVHNTAQALATSDADVPHVDFRTMKKDFSRLIAQDEPTARIHTIIRRNHASAFNRDKPLSMLLPGSSGVGKTETARIVSRHLTGVEPIRLNMNEYSNEADITKITGSSAGYIGSDSKRELPLDALRSNPYRVLLLDEIEKACRSVQHLFLSALDDGYITLSRGDVIDLRKTIIIATTNSARDVAASNAPSTGFDMFKATVKQSAARDLQQRRQSRLTLISHLEKHFAPEFLGRFGYIVAFNFIDRDDFAQILRNTYHDVYTQARDTLVPRSQYLPAQLPENVISSLTDEFYVAKLGARPAATAINEIVGDILDPYTTAKENPLLSDITAQREAENIHNEPPFTQKDHTASHAKTNTATNTEPEQLALFEIDQL